MAEIHEAIACLQRLADAFHVRREQLASTAGLTDHQWAVLEEIATDHFMPSMFARRRRSTAAAVSKTLRQLTDRGLVEASVDAHDARQRRYGLTAHGQRVMEDLRGERQAAIDRIWTDLDARALRGFIDFGGQITERLERYAGQQGMPAPPAKNARRPPSSGVARGPAGRANGRTQKNDETGRTGKRDGKNAVRQGL